MTYDRIVFYAPMKAELSSRLWMACGYTYYALYGFLKHES
jgi:hypothetical protein